MDPRLEQAKASKGDIRLYFATVRSNLTQERRIAAVTAGKNALISLLDQGPKSELVLSYKSFGAEFCTEEINRFLLSQKKLVLPKVEGGTLALYRVFDLTKDLENGAFGMLEPNPNVCQKVDSAAIYQALIPGIAFDPLRHRIGYGKGYYDRFLCDFKAPFETIGIGFSEQFYPYPFPVELTDIPLSKVLFF